MMLNDDWVGNPPLQRASARKWRVIELREEILCCHCDYFHSDEALYKSEMKRVVQAYLDSRMPYEQYIQEKFNQDEDYFPEFMYADDIELNQFHLHELSQFLNETEIEN